jgi:hypothetical protein
MSLLKANSVQIGQSATATQNFTLSVPSSPDGTIKLARGNSGSTTADILSVSSSGAVTINNMSNQSFRNRIKNGDCRIDQRNAGASVAFAANTNGYTIDRWKLTQNGTAASTVQRSTVVPTGQGFTNSLLTTITTAETAVGTGNKTCGYYYMLEGYDTSDFGWGTTSAQTITISFWVRSSVVGTYSFSVMNTAWNRSYNSSYTITTANTWEKKIFTVPGDTGATSMDTTNGTALSLVFDLGFSPMYESATANAWQGSSSYALSGCTKLSSTVGATFYLTGLQLEVGTSATEFERRPFGVELALCQRYYEKSYLLSTVVGSNSTQGLHQGINATDGNQVTGLRFMVAKRDAPTVTIWSKTGTVATVSNTSYTNGANPGTWNASDISEFGFRCVVGTGGLAANTAWNYHFRAEIEL